jgi:excisionase family DNA binding protein
MVRYLVTDAREGLSVEEAARLLNTSPATVRRRVQDGTLKTVEGESTLRLDDTQVRQLLAAELAHRGIEHGSDSQTAASTASPVDILDSADRRAAQSDGDNRQAIAGLIDAQRRAVRASLQEIDAHIKTLEARRQEIEAQLATLDVLDILRPDAMTH